MRPGAADERFHVFRCKGGSTVTFGADVLAEFDVARWRPGIGRILPPHQRSSFAAWWTFHHSGVFRNRNYTVVLVVDRGMVIHRSCVIPPWFRWPFMGAKDIHISDTWTAPDYRGRGIAAAVASSIATTADPSGHVWYAAEVSNVASAAVARTIGMELVGPAVRTRRLGSRFLGQLQLTEPLVQ